MTATTDRLNSIYAEHKDNCSGSFHNFLWQVMINQSLGGQVAALANFPGIDGAIIALADGGYIPAMFEADDKTIDALNLEVFGVARRAQIRIVCASMASPYPKA